MAYVTAMSMFMLQQRCAEPFGGLPRVFRPLPCLTEHRARCGTQGPSSIAVRPNCARVLENDPGPLFTWHVDQPPVFAPSEAGFGNSDRPRSNQFAFCGLNHSDFCSSCNAF